MRGWDLAARAGLSANRGWFGRENIRTILRNPAYIGMVRCKEVVAPGNHPALVAQDIWERCQALLNERTTKPGVMPVRDTAFFRPQPDPPDGPTDQFYTHVASPEIYVDESRKRLVMWTHGWWTNDQQ